ncbi:MAG: TonB-dependent receptor, partial [Microbacterium sp.]|nr:TonB-dependent receptor [Microbacterium sp.]
MQTTRSVRPFEVVSEYSPSGDQPQAIADLAARINAGETDVVLLGATGTGKSATTAWLIEQVQRPTLVLAHNKTLAAQLANEFRDLMPHNAVEYFVSYYDYYQPEAYVPQTDTFIEKDSSINAEVERLRHSTTNSLLSRRDVVVVSTVSCIYGLGAPEEYLRAMVALQVGERYDRDALIRQFIAMQYNRNDVDFSRGNFRVRSNLNLDWQYGDLGIGWTTRYYSGMKEKCSYDLDGGPECNLPDFRSPYTDVQPSRKVGANTLHDLQVRYSLPWNGTVSLGVNNVF